MTSERQNSILLILPLNKNGALNILIYKWLLKEFALIELLFIESCFLR